MATPTARPRRDAAVLDVALTAAIAGIAVISLVVGGDPEVTGPELADYSRPVGVALAALAIAPLLVRRRFPCAVLVVVTVSLSLRTILEIPEGSGIALAFYVAFYTAGAFGEPAPRRRLVRVAASVVIAALMVLEVARAADDAPDSNFVLLIALTVGLNAIYLAAAWFMGDLVRNRRRREAELEAAAAELREAQAERARQAVVSERLRIARELHDVLAHHVSVMGVQAAAARRVLGSRPDEVPPLLSSIEASSRDAVLELQRMLGLLREVDGSAANGQPDAPPGPQPGIARLQDLVSDMNEAGLRVDLRADDVGTVTSAVDLSAYRIVQEALTNTLKHAGPGTAVDVELRRSGAAVEVIVLDDGDAAPGTRTEGTGNGILGMRERVTLTGGELRTGPRPGRGWEVRAWFPT